MINEANQITVPYVLSDAVYNAYEKIKELILRIFSLIKLNDIKLPRLVEAVDF